MYGTVLWTVDGRLEEDSILTCSYDLNTLLDDEVYLIGSGSDADGLTFFCCLNRLLDLAERAERRPLRTDIIRLSLRWLSIGMETGLRATYQREPYPKEGQADRFDPKLTHLILHLLFLHYPSQVTFNITVEDT
jgi:hypothetical protein